MVVGGCRVRFLMKHTLLYFGQSKVWAADDWDAARSLSLLHLSFAASCLSESNNYDWFFSLMSASCLGLRLPAATTDG